MSTRRAEFSQHVARFVDILGLSDWRVHSKGAEPDANSLAETHIDYDQRLAHVHLNPEPEPDEDLEALAFHEVLHILLADLDDALDNRDKRTRKRQFSSREHGVIERLLKAYLGRSL